MLPLNSKGHMETDSDLYADSQDVNIGGQMDDKAIPHSKNIYRNTDMYYFTYTSNSTEGDMFKLSPLENMSRKYEETVVENYSLESNNGSKDPNKSKNGR